MWSTLSFLALRRLLRLLGLGPKPDDKDVEIAVLATNSRSSSARLLVLVRRGRSRSCSRCWSGSSHGIAGLSSSWRRRPCCAGTGSWSARTGPRLADLSAVGFPTRPWNWCAPGPAEPHWGYMASPGNEPSGVSVSVSGAQCHASSPARTGSQTGVTHLGRVLEVASVGCAGVRLFSVEPVSRQRLVLFYRTGTSPGVPGRRHRSSRRAAGRPSRRATWRCRSTTKAVASGS